MGCSLINRCSSSPYSVEDSNPNPKKFSILYEAKIYDFLLLVVWYPNCTNFEGNKILVYEGFDTSKELLSKTNGELDPHFSVGISPIARFKPTTNSGILALEFIKALNEIRKIKD